MIDLLHLTARTCAYPLTGTGETIRFCGAQPKEGSSYCAGHHALAYLPPKLARREIRAIVAISGRQQRMTSHPRVDAAE